MSSTSSEPENAAPAAPVSPGQGYKNTRDDDQNKTQRWTQPPRSKSVSLLTQALATNYEAEESPSATTSISSSSEGLTNLQQRSNGLSRNNREGVEDQENKMAIVASGSAENPRATISLGTTPISNSTQFNLHDMSQVNSLLSNHRTLLNKARGRGTSLERTDKEKRVQELPKGTYSTNPGDTGMIRGPTHLGQVTPDSITTNPPTEGVRARYRYWRDVRPGMPSEKAWSIGEQESDDSQGGQVEKSITDALAGVEPNNRSRKASHSLRFFKEGLPEDKSKKREAKSRGRSKDGTSRRKGPVAAEIEKQETSTPETEHSQKGSRLPDGQSPLHSPLERAPLKHSTDPKLNPTIGLAAEEGYFDVSNNIETVSEDQVRAMPAQLLEEIRKHHNLTPGAAKGSSFSRSIPVTESEKPKPDGDKDEPKSTGASWKEDSSYGGAQLSQVKSVDDDEDSGEEQISSALFVPHQTPREPSERERTGLESISRPRLSDHLDISNSQQWLEEHKVPSRDIDQKYIGQEARADSRPLPSPVHAKQPTPFSQLESFPPGTHDASDIDQESHDEGDYTTKDEESSFTDDADTTPTGSLKQSYQLPSSYKDHIHDHQQIPKEPLEAIELIPYRHQVGGHTTMWRFSKRAVCKQLNNRENEFYERVERYHPQLLKFLPRYVWAFFCPIESPGLEAESVQRPHVPVQCPSDNFNC
jgi:inositol-hexakisphosphate kinase